MATKLKRFSTNKITKAIAFILLVGLITSVVTQLLVAMYRSHDIEAIFEKEYKHSDHYRSDVNVAISNMFNALEDGGKPRLSTAIVSRSEDVIHKILTNNNDGDEFTSGRTYIENTMAGNMNMDELTEYNKCIDEIEAYKEYISENLDDLAKYTAGYENDIASYVEYLDEIMMYKDNLIYALSDEISNFYGKLNYYYYATNGKQTFSNIEFTDKEDFERLADEVYFYENGAWTKSGGALSDYLYNNQWWHNEGKNTFYLAFTNESIAEIQTQWETARKQELPLFIHVISNVIVGFFIVLYLMLVTGRKPNQEELQLYRIDNIYSDILAGSAFAIFIATGFAGTDMFYQLDRYGYRNVSLGSYQIFMLIILAIMIAACSAVYIFAFLSLVRKFKARKLLKHTLTAFLLSIIFDFLKSLFDGRKFKKYPLTKSLFYRQVIFISVSGILVLIAGLFALMRSPLFLVTPLLEIVLIYWYTKGNNKTFEEINKGFNESLEEQMRAERMKIALVTNVSHDLKTPLTSIISYIDLLSREFKEQNFTNINDYINILAEKSDRLKHIVADLFDLAKSTSGNIDLNFETLDMKKLIEQTLADMSDRMEESGLLLKVKLPEAPLFVSSDGKKLYRVLQNIIDNAIKYSLNGTRVFIELTESDKKAVIEIKNTSAYEMDFTAEDVLGRFTRGDKSRSTEGSGLGLSIAESFTNACGGMFNVSVDGDQFKILIELPLKGFQ